MKLSLFRQERFQNKQIIFVDPSLGSEIRLDLKTFLEAWEALDNQGLAIWEKNQKSGVSSLNGKKRKNPLVGLVDLSFT